MKAARSSRITQSAIGGGQRTDPPYLAEWLFPTADGTRRARPCLGCPRSRGSAALPE